MEITFYEDMEEYEKFSNVIKKVEKFAAFASKEDAPKTASLLETTAKKILDASFALEDTRAKKEKALSDEEGRAFSFMIDKLENTLLDCLKVLEEQAKEEGFRGEYQSMYVERF